MSESRAHAARALIQAFSFRHQFLPLLPLQLRPCRSIRAIELDVEQRKIGVAADERFHWRRGPRAIECRRDLRGGRSRCR